MRVLQLVMIMFVLTGCSLPSINKHVDQLTPYHIAEHKSKTIAVSKITDEIGPGKIIGKFHGGIWCVPQGPSGNLRWVSNQAAFTHFENILRKKLEENGYSLLGKAFSPFNDEFTKQAELLLGSRIIDIVANVCGSVKGVKGEVYLKIEWEVYDTKSKQIILKTITEGYSKALDFIGPSDIELYGQAFSMAAENLLANDKFYNLLVPDN